RVSTLHCASHVDINPAPPLPLPRPSTRCGVVNQQKKRLWRFGRLVAVGGGPPPSSPTSLTSFSPPDPLHSRCRDRRGGGVRTPGNRFRGRTGRHAAGWGVS